MKRPLHVDDISGEEGRIRFEVRLAASVSEQVM